MFGLDWWQPKVFPVYQSCLPEKLRIIVQVSLCISSLAFRGTYYLTGPAGPIFGWQGRHFLFCKIQAIMSWIYWNVLNQIALPYSQGCILLTYLSVISSKFIQKLAQKCQYFTLIDQSVPLYNFYITFCLRTNQLCGYVVPVKSKVKISQNFLAFSEFMNFT